MTYSFDDIFIHILLYRFYQSNYQIWMNDFAI